MVLRLLRRVAAGSGAGDNSPPNRQLEGPCSPVSRRRGNDFPNNFRVSGSRHSRTLLDGCDAHSDFRVVVAVIIFPQQRLSFLMASHEAIFYVR